MSGPFKLNYKNSAFPFRTSEDNITKLEKSLETEKRKEGAYPISYDEFFFEKALRSVI